MFAFDPKRVQHEAQPKAKALSPTCSPAAPRPNSHHGGAIMSADARAVALRRAVLQRKPAPSANDDTRLDMGVALRTSEQGGEPLPKAVRDFFEPCFGYDFSRVRVHTDDPAARAVQARAYTLGQNIVFARGEYVPGTAEGKRLLAHELAHVVQSDSPASRAGSAALAIVPPDDASEKQADAVADAVVDGSRASSIPQWSVSPAVPGALHRKLSMPPPKFHAGQVVAANIAFGLMDRLGGQSGQKRVKQIQKGDLLKVEGAVPNSAGLAYSVVVMKDRDNEEIAEDGSRKVGVASAYWLSVAQASHPAPVNPSTPTPAGGSKDRGPVHPEKPEDVETIDFELGPGNEATYTAVRSLPNYVDNKVQAVGVGAQLGGYLLFVDGLDLPVFLPEAYVNRAQAADTTNVSDWAVVVFEVVEALEPIDL